MLYIVVNARVSVFIGVHLRLAFSGQPISSTLQVMKKTSCAFFQGLRTAAATTLLWQALPFGILLASKYSKAKRYRYSDSFRPGCERL